MTMTRTQLEAAFVRMGKTREQARHLGGLYDSEDDPADRGQDDNVPELPYPPDYADFDEDYDDGRFDDDPNVYHGNYSEE